MKITHIISATALFLLFGNSHSAVHISPNKTGEVIIVPMYTVSNNMNTLLSINNTTDDNKAIKVHFKESRYGNILTSFNLYLSGQDMWTMVTAKVDGKIKMQSTDTSCTIGFPNYPQNIQAYNSWLWENGTIEIIEMGTVDHFEAPSNFRNCEHLNQLWEQGQAWAEDSENLMSPASGGLHAEVTFMDVEQGHSANIPLLHLEGFYGEDNIQHTPAGNAFPDLSSGTHDSLVFSQGQAFRTTWPTGFEAVSALMTKNVLHNEFEDNAASFSTNWVTSFPTLHYHLRSNNTAPFFMTDEGGIRFPGGENHVGFIPYTRDTYYQINHPCDGGVMCLFPKIWNSIGHSTINYILFKQEPSASISNIEAANTYFINDGFYSYKNHAGKIEVLTYDDYPYYSYSVINNRGINTSTQARQTYVGLPVIGFAYIIQSSNGAQPDKLSNYAYTKKHFGHALITE